MPTKKDPAKRKYSAVEKKIARLLAQMPPDILLQLYDLTKDQIEHWLLLRKFYKDVSECWKAMHTGKNDPLAPLLKSGEINSNTYDYIWLTVDFYERLWELIQISFRHIQPEFERLGLDVPETAFELFIWIISDAATAEFSVCLKDYVELSGRKPVEEYQLASKLYQGEALVPHEKKRIPSLLSESRFKRDSQIHPALIITLAVCYKKVSKRQTILKVKLEAFHTALFGLIEKNKKIRWHAGSYAWNKGEFIKSRKGGNYAPKTFPP